MNEQLLRERISILVAQRNRAESFLNGLQEDILRLTGAIQENTEWLECLVTNQKTELEAKARERAKKTRQRKKTTITVARDDRSTHQGHADETSVVVQDEMQSEAA
jgi:hypothetical protein